MSYNPAEGFPRVVPALRYEDVGAAVEWLTGAFGFRELLRWTDESGRTGHADIELEGGVVMLEAGPAGFPNARDGQDRTTILVWVGDVDLHFARAAAAGAEIVERPVDKPWGLRRYMARDLEGHVWQFNQHIRDVEPAAWGARSGPVSGVPDIARHAAAATPGAQP
jgi:PhnB protein